MSENSLNLPPTPKDKWVPKEIDDEQIDFAWDLIKEFHPLADTPIHVAYPYLRYLCLCSSCCTSEPAIGQESSLNEPLLPVKRGPIIKTKSGKEVQLKKKPSKKKPVQSEIEKEDPINQLGFGIVAYRDLLWNLIWVFAVISIVVLPTMMIYRNGTGYATEAVVGYEINSIGNLGYSSVQCSTIPIGVQQMDIQCPYGRVGEVYDFGVQPPINNLTQDICQTTTANELCKPKNPLIGQEIEKALNQTQFSFHFTIDELWPTKNVSSECSRPTSTLFVQYSCIQDSDEQNLKFQGMTVAVSTAVFISLLFSFFVIGFYNKQKLNQLQWDMSTVTVADYAVEFPIPPETYAMWKLNVYLAENGDAEKGIPIALSLKHYLKEKIEKFLTDDRKKAAGIEEKPTAARSRVLRRLNKVEEVKIADITFGYANEELIFALQKRGKLIAHNEFHKLHDEDNKISQVVHEKYEELTRPTAAFVIFDEEEGASQALKCTGKCDREIMGAPVKFHAASEPTDIIWENRHFYPEFNTDIFCCRSGSTPMESRICREVIGYAFVIVCLSLSFLFILFLASLEIKFAQIFPPQNCDAIENTYGDTIEEYAYYDYLFVSNTKNMASSGCLMCFCDAQVAEYGYQNTSETNYTAPNMEPEDICYQYLKLNFKAQFLGASFSYILIGFNYVLRTIVIMVVVWIGYATQTAQLERITTVTFLCQFFNTAFILMLVNADLSEQPITLMFTWGQNGDFNSSFFKTIGNQLVSTMMFNMYYPLLEFLMYWGMRVGFRILNRGICSCSKYDSKSTSVKQYQDVYSGPSYYIHYKYSTILNTVFVTFMFGFGIPIFFPIALGSMAILYFIEKSMLYWSYQQPPMYDERLNDSVLAKLKYAPIFFLSFGYWMASSNQLLSNDFLNPIYKASDTRQTDHVALDIFTANGWSTPAFPLLVMCLLTLFFCWFGCYIMPCFEKCCPKIRIAAIDIDQPIDSYFASCDEHDRNWTVMEEENARENLANLKILTDDTYEKMRDTKPTDGATLQGVHSYDILANPLYSDMFQYVNASIPNRTDYIIDDDEDEGNDAIQSDLVRAVLNLSFMTEEKAMNFKFCKYAYGEQLNSKIAMSLRSKFSKKSQEELEENA